MNPFTSGLKEFIIFCNSFYILLIEIFFLKLNKITLVFKFFFSARKIPKSILNIAFTNALPLV
ncbi:hypothetical protein A8B98_12205 [Hymenobacter sp. UV11]|nr:hypothetical protein A8B98_12205 [Hymenobacter sp. UV11]